MQLHLISSSFKGFIGFSFFFVIGWSDNFGFVFTKRSWNVLCVAQLLVFHMGL